MRPAPVQITQLGPRTAQDFPVLPGRAHDVVRLSEALRRHPAVTITGFHGVGKSTLAATFVAHVVAGERAEHDRVAWMGLRGDESFAEVAVPLLAAVGAPPGVDAAAFGRWSEPRQASAVLEALRAARALVVLDHLEVPLDRRTLAPRDGGFAHFLQGAIEGLGASRLVATARQGPGGVTGLGPERFRLGGLTPADGARHLQALGVGTVAGDDADLLQRASERVGGHPVGLRVLSLLVTRRDSGRGLRGYVVDPRLWGGSPEEVVQRLFERLVAQSLDEQQRRVLLATSFFDQPVDTDAVAAAAGMDATDVAGACQSLAADDLVTPTRAGWLLQPLLADGVRRRLKSSVRARVHKRLVAFWLQRHAPGGDATLEPLRPGLMSVRHALAAGDRAQAGEIALASGLADALMERGYLARCLELLLSLTALDEAPAAGAPPDANHLHLAQRCLQVMIELDRTAEGIGFGMRALSLAERAADRTAEGWILWAVGSLSLKVGDAARAHGCFVRAQQAARSGGDLSTEAASWLGLGQASFARGQVDEALRAFDRSVTVYGESGDHYGRGLGLFYSASVLEGRGDLRGAGERAQLAHVLLAETGSDMAQPVDEMLRRLKARGVL